jgi:type VI secretion system protein ImpL
MMRKLIEFFKKRWVIQLIGVIALSAILWFLIPLFTLDKMVLWVRLAVIVFLLLLFFISLILSARKAKQAEQSMMDEISQADTTADQSAEELQVLKERFDEALGVLKKNRKGGMLDSGEHLYELPWFIIIGPPGSGKTTALLNSGLRFPLADRFGQDAIRGVGGTRNCDWWFTEDAVLLDTAGRYTTQDSQASVDANAWSGFLDLLKKHRKRRPINGILIAASISDLMLQTIEERSLHAHAIRNRIQELNQRLGVDAPVYMIFTKCDLIAGFSEFYENLGQEERAQVWGMTFPLDEVPTQTSQIALFPQEYDALLQRINDRMLSRMDQERDIHRRTLIYGFPQELASLKQPLKLFLDELFQTSRYDTNALLRGVYFTSGTQEGTPIDRLLGNLAQSFGLDRVSLPSFSGRGRSYFIQGLLRRIIFPESSLAGTDKKVERRRTWLQRVAYAGALGLAGIMALAWTTSFTRNQIGIEKLDDTLESYEEKIPDLPFRTTDFATLLNPLDDLHAATEVFPEDAPLSMGLGLYQGRKLRPSSESAYERVLEGRFLYSLGMRLEEHLQSTRQKELLRETLKVYLMLGQPKHLDAENIKLFMSVDWANSLPGEDEAQSRLQSHLDRLLKSDFKPLPLNAQLVSQTRDLLTDIPLSQQVYASVRQRAATDKSMDFRLSSALGRHGDLVFTLPGGTIGGKVIPGLYTKRGYYDFFLPNGYDMIKATLSENWILSDEESPEATEAELQQLLQEVKALYVEDYISQWRGLLNGLKIVKLDGISQAVEVLDVASGPSSPLRKLLHSVEQNTTLSKPPADLLKGLPDMDKAKGIADAITDISSKAQGQRYRLQQLMRAADAAGDATEKQDQGDPIILQVDEEFERLNDLAQQRGGAPAPIEALIGDLGDLTNFLSDLEAAGGEGALEAAKGAGGSKDPVKLLRRRAKRLPRPLNKWIFALSDRGWGVVVGSSRRQLSTIIGAEVAPLCERGIQGRYPLNKNTDKEVTLSDFGRFFAPGGVMDSFFEEQIKPFANTLTRPWRWKDAGGHPMGISVSTLRQFERAAQIRKVFFSSGGEKPKVRFSLKPLYLDADASRFMLDLDGQKISYRHGPARTSQVTWPAPDPIGRVSILFEDLKGKTVRASQEVPGPGSGCWTGWR